MNNEFISVGGKSLFVDRFRFRLGPGVQEPSPDILNVPFWPKAGIPSCTAHVCFRG
jgi:hypothetical protein